MCHRSVNALATGLVFALALAGCGSTPEVSTPPAQPPVAAQPEAPAAETFPLESGQQARPVESEPSANGPAPASEIKPTPTGAAPAAPPGTTEPPLPPEAVQQFDNAVAMVSAGNLAAAEGAFRALSTTYPSYSGPLVNLGILQIKAGRLDEAEKTLQSAIERKADNAVAYNQLGIVRRKQGRFKEADEAYTRAVQIDPNYANAYLNLGVLCDLYLQQPQRALEAFERYLSLASTPDRSPSAAGAGAQERPPDEKVGAWVKELKVRLGNAQRSAEAGS